MIVVLSKLLHHADTDTCVHFRGLSEGGPGQPVPFWETQKRRGHVPNPLKATPSAPSHHAPPATHFPRVQLQGNRVPDTNAGFGVDMACGPGPTSATETQPRPRWVGEAGTQLQQHSHSKLSCDNGPLPSEAEDENTHRPYFSGWKNPKRLPRGWCRGAPPYGTRGGCCPVSERRGPRGARTHTLWSRQGRSQEKSGPLLGLTQPLHGLSLAQETSPASARAHQQHRSGPGKTPSSPASNAPRITPWVSPSLTCSPGPGPAPSRQLAGAWGPRGRWSVWAELGEASLTAGWPRAAD